MENGYPAFSLDFPDKVLIKTKNPIYNSTIKIHSSDRKYSRLFFRNYIFYFIANTRVCCRCSKTYRINQDGEYIKQEECIYHWGRIRTQRGENKILFG